MTFDNQLEHIREWSWLREARQTKDLIQFLSLIKYFLGQASGSLVTTLEYKKSYENHLRSRSA